MALDNQNEKMRQSSVITRIGCFGAILVIALLLIAGSMALRSSLVAKKANALGSLALIREQIEKAPSILANADVMGCGITQEDIDGLRQDIENLGKASITDLDKEWWKIDKLWSGVEIRCGSMEGNVALRDVKIQFEGIRNRRSIERGKYKEAAAIYNEALMEFPANLGITGLKPLETGEEK
jgi:hypothetical protein